MSAFFFNHVRITGSTSERDRFIHWCGINEEMIDVDDGASCAQQFMKDEQRNRNNHKQFVDFINKDADGRFDRIRIESTGAGLQVAFDSWRCSGRSLIELFAVNFPTLAFHLVSVFGEGATEVFFEEGKWIEYDDAPDPHATAVGRVGDCSGIRITPICDSAVGIKINAKSSQPISTDLIDIELLQFVENHRPIRPESEMDKLNRRANEAIARWSDSDGRMERE